MTDKIKKAKLFDDDEWADFLLEHSNDQGWVHEGDVERYIAEQDSRVTAERKEWQAALDKEKARADEADEFAKDMANAETIQWVRAKRLEKFIREIKKDLGSIGVEAEFELEPLTSSSLHNIGMDKAEAKLKTTAKELERIAEKYCSVIIKKELRTLATWVWLEV